MLIKGITDEDFVNYKVPSMFIATAICSFKCDKEYGSPICQNSALAKQPSLDIPIKLMVTRYLANPITKAIVFGGLEPFDQLMELFAFVEAVRQPNETDDDIVIYTGYNKKELQNSIFVDKYHFDGYNVSKKCTAHIDIIDILSEYKNIIIKYGRYIPGHKPHFDPVLGVNLASDNQYAERIS